MSYKAEEYHNQMLKRDFQLMSQALQQKSEEFEGLKNEMIQVKHLASIASEKSSKLQRAIDYIKTCHLTPEIKRELERILE